MNGDMQYLFSLRSAEERVCIIVDSYFGMAEMKLKHGLQIPGLIKERFYEWLHASKPGYTGDAAMMRTLTDEGTEPCPPEDYRREACYPIEEVSDMLDVHTWTIRMWVNRFGELNPQRSSEDCLMFTPRDVGRIAKIRRLIKIRGITIHDIMKRL